MILSGVAFIISIPVIALSHGYAPLFFGRLLQGMSGGFIGIVVPLYLAECLSASTRGKGTGVFQWLLTFGIVAAALVGIYFSYRVDAVARLSRPRIAPGLQRTSPGAASSGSRCLPACCSSSAAFMVTESPRWLYVARSRIRPALLSSAPARPNRQPLSCRKWQPPPSRRKLPAARVSDSLLRRKYVIPFLLACVILACNTATGINSVIGFNTGYPSAKRPRDLQAHWGYVLFTAFNFSFTAIGMMLVDRKGRKFLFILGTSGIILSMVTVGTIFLRTEKPEHRLRPPDSGAGRSGPGT